VKKFMKTGTLELDIRSDYPATVKVEPLDIIQTLDGGTPTLMALPEGSYNVEISAFGHVTKHELVNIAAKETTSLSLDLEPTARHTLTARITDTTGRALQATVAFLNTPIEVSYAIGGDFQKSIPEGTYDVVFSFRGYRADRGTLNLNQGKVLDVILERAPGTLLVQGDSSSAYNQYYSDSMESLSKDFELKSQIGEVSSYDLLAYDTVLWFTGDLEADVLSKTQRKALDKYVHDGGNLIMVGKGIGNALGGTKFYSDVLGATFKGDRKWWRTVTGFGLSFGLDEDGSAKNQDTPDALGLSDKKATSLFSYRFGSDAGLARTHGAGRVVYLGFGVEGIGDADTRHAVMQALFQSAKSTLAAKLTRLESAYRGDRALHQLLSTEITIQKEDVATFQAFLKTRNSKAPFQNQIFQVQNLEK